MQVLAKNMAAKKNTLRSINLKLHYCIVLILCANRLVFQQLLSRFSIRRICSREQRKKQLDWLATNTDVITSQSHSLFACLREQIRQVENGFREGFRLDVLNKEQAKEFVFSFLQHFNLKTLSFYTFSDIVYDLVSLNFIEIFFL